MPRLPNSYQRRFLVRLWLRLMPKTKNGPRRDRLIWCWSRLVNGQTAFSDLRF